MRSRTAPFGNDLQDDFDVKLINGRIVQISKDILVRAEKKTLKEEQHLQQATIKTGYNDKSPQEKCKLPLIQPAAGKPHSKTSFHSAPPKLSSKGNCSGRLATLDPLLHDAEPIVSDSSAMLSSQLLTVQRKRPHTLEDIECSCRRLDAFRSGTISLQELADILYINGISINSEILREFCDHNTLHITDGNRVSYRDFLSKMSTSSGCRNYRDSVNSKRQIVGPQNNITSLEMEKRNRKQKSPSHHRQADLSSGNNRRMIVSCPERVSMVATHDAIDNDESLLDDLQDCFSGTRWGNRGDVHRLESRLAMADKHHQGLLPASVVSVMLYAIFTISKSKVK